MHDANVAAARVKEAQKKKEQKKVPSDEEDELDGQDEDRGEDSSSSSESQHAEKQDTIERARDKSKTLAKERSAEEHLQDQIDRQKKVNDRKIMELTKTSESYPTEDEVQNPTHKYPFRIIISYFSCRLIICFGLVTAAHWKSSNRKRFTR